VRAGDDRAFELLFMRYEARISAYVRGMVRDHGRAEDVTQEVFIAALRRMRETDRPIAFKPWIYEIAKNACIDAFRRTRNTNEVSFDAGDSLKPADQRRLTAAGSEPDDVVDTKLALDDLCGAFGGLSPSHHEILVMREFEGLSYREIGDRLGLSRAAVESTLFRARRRLGEEYEEIASGKRCLRVRGIVDGSSGRASGLRDRRRMARHISHCQPCRRYAVHAGVDVRAVRDPASSVAKVAALMPLPGFLRRRLDIDEAGGLLTQHAPALHVVGVLDPATVSGWSKAVATAATVAVAGLGTGAAVGEREALRDFATHAPSMIGMAPERPAAGAAPATPARITRGTPLTRPAAPSQGARIVRRPAGSTAALALEPATPAASTPAQPSAGTHAPGAPERPAQPVTTTTLPELSIDTSGSGRSSGDAPKQPIGDGVGGVGVAVGVTGPGVGSGGARTGDVAAGASAPAEASAVGQMGGLSGAPIVGDVLQSAGAGSD